MNRLSDSYPIVSVDNLIHLSDAKSSPKGQDKCYQVIHTFTFQIFEKITDIYQLLGSVLCKNCSTKITFFCFKKCLLDFRGPTLVLTPLIQLEINKLSNLNNYL